MLNLNKKQTESSAKRIHSKKMALRTQLWGELDPSVLWSRKINDGYTTLPRTMPLIFQIMDNLAEKSKPVSMVYFSLWCRVFDESIIEIKSQDEMAAESGFTGQRAVSTWKSRMKNLVSLGFIEVREGAAGEYSFVLLLNPYTVIKKYQQKGEIQGGKFNILFVRAQEVGAKDLE